AEGVEDRFQHREGQLQRVVEGAQRPRAVEPQVAEHQVVNHRARYPQVFHALRAGGPAILPDDLRDRFGGRHPPGVYTGRIPGTSTPLVNVSPSTSTI